MGLRLRSTAALVVACGLAVLLQDSEAAGAIAPPRLAVVRVIGETVTVRITRVPRRAVRIELRVQRPDRPTRTIRRKLPRRTVVVPAARGPEGGRIRGRSCLPRRCSPWSGGLSFARRGVTPPPTPPGVVGEPQDASTVSQIGGCQIFPGTNPWNLSVASAPVDANSDRYVRNSMAGHDIHLDLGSNEEHYGIPYTVIGRDQPSVPIRFGVDGEDYGDESDHGPLPIPLDAPIEGGSRGQPDPTAGDRHVIAVQRGTCRLFELYRAVRETDGWRVSSSAQFDLTSNDLRPAGWTSADAAGLPIFAGLLRYDEAATGEIRHALRFTLRHAQAAYVAPARHAGPSAETGCLPYGARVRLRADFDEGPYSGPSLAIVRALKRYGMLFADQGSPMYVSGTSNPAWAETIDILHRGHPIPGDAFEVVRLPPITRRLPSPGDVGSAC